jgi:hypothetical protein
MTSAPRLQVKRARRSKICNLAKNRALARIVARLQTPIESEVSSSLSSPIQTNGGFKTAISIGHCNT